MSTPYIPAKDSLLDTWAQNFAATITANPGAYGLAASDATTITAAYTSYHSAYILLTSPATKTPSNVAAKDIAKASSLITFRTYAQIIQNNAGVTNSAKSAAGLTVRSTARTPIPAPTTTPVLNFVSGQPGVANLGYADAASPTTKAKPFGAIQVEIWYDVPATGSPVLDNAVFLGLETKSPFQFPTPDGAKGKTIGIWARWTTRRGLTGPWSAELDIIGT
jgi:hypothetical protein